MQASCADNLARPGDPPGSNHARRRPELLKKLTGEERDRSNRHSAAHELTADAVRCAERKFRRALTET